MKHSSFATAALIIILGFPLTVQARAVVSQGTLGEVDLLEILKLRLQHPKTDPFTGEYTSRFDGRHFAIVQTLRQENGSEYGETNARWSYALGSHQLSIYTNEGFSSKGVEFFYKSKVLGHYVGRTAFGAKARVTAYDETSGTIIPNNSYSDAPALKVDLDLAPEEARALVSSTVLEVEGNLAAVDGVTTSCDHTKTEGSLDNPNAFVSFDCSINASITRIAFIDLRSHHVVAEWPKAPDPKLTHLEAVKPTAPLIAPEVIGTYPVAGSTIPAGTLVLKAVFNQPMLEDDWDVSKRDGLDFPACLSRPRLLPDQKTFVLLCSTVRERAYGMKLTAKSAQGGKVTKYLIFSTAADGEQVRAVSDAITAAGLTSADSPIASR